MALYKPIRASWEHIIKEMIDLEDLEKDIEQLLEIQNDDIGGTAGHASFR